MQAQQSAPPSTAPGLPRSRRFFRRVRSAFLQHELLYRICLKWKYGASQVDAAPAAAAQLPNCVLQSRAEWQQAAQRGRALHVPLHRAQEKNWDHLAAVDAIVATTPRSGRILDAGAEFYSNVLPSLYVYGYRELYGMNLSYADPARRGSIRYIPGDITQTGFAGGYFDAITCMSVIEHGVPLEAYFREMFRLLKPGGLLITSTDYYPEPIDTGNLSAYGSPIKIFSRQEAQQMIALAKLCGFQSTGEINWECAERPIRWENYQLDFTFLIFTLRKPA
jgi:SAM-dependent methyltransferase